MMKIRRHKPLATKRGSSTRIPICYVDSSTTNSGAFYTGPICEYKQQNIELDICQSSEAAKQWSRDNYYKKEEKPWIKSWYYPTDAFNPWPSTGTNLCCWWCSYEFNWSPFPLPLQYDRLSQRYKVIGIFCGPSCAKAYAMTKDNIAVSSKICYFIEKIACDFYGYDLHTETGIYKKCTIPVAPPKEILQKYCGSNGFTINQYRKMCMCGRSLKVLDMHFITIKQVIEAEQQMARTHNKVYHGENPDNIQTIDMLVTKKRVPYAGAGVRRIADFIKAKT
jgi:hypothetical protein